MTDMSAAAARKVWGLAKLPMAAAAGLMFALVTRLADRGFTNASKVTGVAILALFAFMIADTVRNGIKTGPERLWQRVIPGIVITAIWIPIWLLVCFLTLMIFGWRIVPDPGPIYFQLRKSYIESHWQTDPKTGRRYFAIDYFEVLTGVDAGKFFPRNFFMPIDRTAAFVFFGDCGDSKNDAKKVSDNVYLIRAYADYPEATMNPCLIMPSSKPN